MALSNPKWPISSWFLVALFLSPAAMAQETCSELLSAAETQYVDARFDLTIQLVDRCLRQDGLTRGDIIGSYRLLALAYMRMDQLGEARLTILHLLNEVPDYRPDAIGDPPDYTVLVESVLAQFTPTQEPERRSWFASNSGWLIGGGAALVGGVVTAILLQSGGGGGSGGSNSGLPPPPDLPH